MNSSLKSSKDLLVNKTFFKPLYMFKSLDNKDRIKYVFDIFSNNRLYLSSVTDFNDPFELLATFSLDATEEEKVNFVSEFVKEEHPSISTNKFLKKCKQRIKYHDENFVLNMNQIRSDMRMICFTENINNILMWSHYAGSHNGIAIEFQCRKGIHTNFTSNIMPVNYSENVPNINWYKDNYRTKVSLLLTNKFKLWEYEDEWRYIHYKQSDNKFIDMPEDIITAVYLGYKLNLEKNKNVKMDLIDLIKSKDCFKTVTFYQSEMDNKNYRMIYRKL